MSRSYGGKLGVWLTGKKRRVAMHHDPVSKRRSFRSREGAPGSFLPAKFMKNFQSKMMADANGKCKHDMDLVGWDDVLCRPIFYNSNSSHNKIAQGDLVTNDCVLLGKNEHVKDDQQPFSAELPMTEDLPKDKENILFDNGIHPWKGVQSSRRDLLVKGVKKQASYGGQKRRGRLLSSMATSVLEQCSSPLHKWQSHNCATKRQVRGKRRRPVTQGRYNSDQTFTSNKLPICDNYTPPRTFASTVCLGSNCSQQEFDGNEEREAGSHGEVDSSDEAELQLPQNTDKHSNRRKIKPYLLGICLRDERQAKKRNTNAMQNEISKRISQPIYSTSLLEARAFFEHLDATHVLKIE